MVDAGANIGYYTLIAAREVGPSGKVFAFEPDPESFALLQKNVAANGFTNVAIDQRALSDRRGRLTLYHNEENRGDHSLFKAHGRPSVEVEAIPLDEYLAGRSVKLLKIDTQGAEGIILDGAAATLSSPDIRVAVEFSPANLAAASYPAEKLLARLDSAGFKNLTDLNEERRTVSRTDAFRLLKQYKIEDESYTNLLAKKD